MSEQCKHYEHIEDVTYRGALFRIGTCQYCGQVKWYDTVNEMGQPVIIHPGRLSGTPIRKEGASKVSRMTSRQRKELLKLGVDRYMGKYGYEPRARSGLTQAYNRALDKQKAKQMKKQMGHVYSDGFTVVHFRLPNLLATAISQLPADPVPLPDDARTHLKTLVSSAIDLVYTPKEYRCLGQRSDQALSSSKS